MAEIVWGKVRLTNGDGSWGQVLNLDIESALWPMTLWHINSLFNPSLSRFYPVLIKREDDGPIFTLVCGLENLASPVTPPQHTRRKN